MILDILKEYKFYDKEKKEKSISASSITKDILQLWFEQNDYEKEEKLSDATLGSIVHLGMEKIFENTFNLKDDVTIEKRFSKEIIGWEITGKPDIIIGDTIYDYKTGKNYSRKQFLKEGKNHPYSIQLSIYNWLIGGNKKAKILWMMKDSKAIDGEPVFIEDDVILMNDTEVETLLVDKILELEKYPSDVMPDECNDLWLRKVKGTVIKMKCKLYCGYKNVCPYFKETIKQSTSSW